MVVHRIARKGSDTSSAKVAETHGNVRRGWNTDNENSPPVSTATTEAEP